MKKYTAIHCIAFILLHFVDVTISENTNQKGITSKMIGGDSE
jgi:hypothetical protein